jgi:hydroxyacylglutathione hydrolase
VFVGDVGRPDLLERAANQEGTMVASARALFRSLRKFRALPDWLQVWPGHGAGSACGKSLGAVPFSTVGYERIANWALAIDDEDTFIRLVLEGQPEPPAYFAEMKRINREGPRILDALPRVHRLPDDALVRLLPAADGANDASGPIIVDTRSAAEYAAGYLPGTINIPLNRSFTTWAGWLVPYDRDIVLICADDHASAEAAIRDLAMIGLDRIAGWVSAHAIDAWIATGRPVATIARTTAADAHAQWRAGAVALLDVRAASEYEQGHVPGALNIPLGALGSRIPEVPSDRPIVVHCQSGSRSAIAASVLAAAGRHDVQDVVGGFTDWTRLGYPVEVEEPARTPAPVG